MLGRPSQKTPRKLLKRVLEPVFRTLVRASVWAARHRPFSPPLTPSKILVVENCALGDVLLSTPTLRRLRELYSQAEISVAVDRRNAAVLLGNPNVRHILPLDAKSPVGFFRAVKQLRSEKFDVAMNCGPSVGNALLVWLAKAPCKIGYFERFDCFEGLNRPIPITGIGIPVANSFSFRSQHLVDRALDVVSSMQQGIGQSQGSRAGVSPVDGGTSQVPLLDLHIPEDLRTEAQNRYLSTGVHRSLIVVHPSAGWPFKTWSPDRFRGLLARLWAMDGDAHIVLIGSEKERPMLNRIASGAGGEVEIVAGKNLLEVGALIDCADVFIGADSGPMHIASSVGTPCVAIFGPSTPRSSGPAGPGHRVLYHQVECSPCNQTVCVRPEDPCINLISVEEVAGAAMEILSEERGQKSAEKTLKVLAAGRELMFPAEG